MQRFCKIKDEIERHWNLLKNLFPKCWVFYSKNTKFEKKKKKKNCRKLSLRNDMCCVLVKLECWRINQLEDIQWYSTEKIVAAAESVHGQPSIRTQQSSQQLNVSLTSLVEILWNDHRLVSQNREIVLLGAAINLKNWIIQMCQVGHQ